MARQGYRPQPPGMVGEGEDLLLRNPLIKRELIARSADLKRIETIGITAMGVCASWFMAAIFYGGLGPLEGAGFAAASVVISWGAMQALLLYSLDKTIRKVRG